MKCLPLAKIDINWVNVCIPVNKSSIMGSGVILFTHHVCGPGNTIWSSPYLTSGPVHKQ